MKIGTVVKLRLSCLGNEIEKRGICFDVQDFGDELGKTYQVIFENGEHCGFGEDEICIFFDVLHDVEFDYTFINTMRVDNDYRAGVFSKMME